MYTMSEAVLPVKHSITFNLYCADKSFSHLLGRTTRNWRFSSDVYQFQKLPGDKHVHHIEKQIN